MGLCDNKWFRLAVDCNDGDLAMLEGCDCCRCGRPDLNVPEDYRMCIKYARDFNIYMCVPL